ncbi:MAG: FAD-binding oxidoreductase, partial [bacterium]
MQLTVLPNQTTGTDLPPTSARLAEALGRALAGRVRFGLHDRQLYSTDASIYQVQPIGVVIPANVPDMVRAVEVCAQHNAAILPRGGGTSLAGQCTAHAVVLDASAGLLGITDVQGTPAGGTCWAEAGVALDELNNHLTRSGTGLFFAPDPSTTAQATIGGCIGNNAAGSRSVKYGRTVDSILAIDCATATGHRLTLGPGAGRADAIALKLADGVTRIVR